MKIPYKWRFLDGTSSISMAIYTMAMLNNQRVPELHWKNRHKISTNHRLSKSRMIWMCLKMRHIPP